MVQSVAPDKHLQSDYSTIYSLLLRKQLENAHAAHQEKPPQLRKIPRLLIRLLQRSVLFTSRVRVRRVNAASSFFRPRKESRSPAMGDSKSTLKISETEKSLKNSPLQKYPPKNLLHLASVRTATRRIITTLVSAQIGRSVLRARSRGTTALTVQKNNSEGCCELKHTL